MSQGRKKAPEGANKTNHTQDSIKYAVLSRLTKKPQSRYDIAAIKLLRTAKALRGINPDQIGMEELL